jgi:peptidoglycan hydrolase-like protein with peptidoglycan-binding domain
MRLRSTAMALAAAGSMLAAPGYVLARGQTGAATSAREGQAHGAQAATNPDTVRQAQQQLQQRGFDVGQVDGQLGATTQQALRDFQQTQGLQPTGRLDRQTLAALGVEAGAGPEPGARGVSGARDADQTAPEQQPGADQSSVDQPDVTTRPSP